MGLPLLSILVLTPLAGAIVVALAPRNDEMLKRLGTAISGLAFLVSLVVFARFRTGVASFQLVERVEWVKDWGIAYHLGIDGISLFLVMLTTFLFPICFLASGGVNKRVKEYVIALLLTEWAILGVFLSQDLVLFYIFWEAVLIPMYLLIGVWGYERRIYATIKFFLFTLAGGLLMLIAIVALHLGVRDAAGAATFAYGDWLAVAPRLALGTQAWLFAAFAIGFAIKVPMFPFHTWLPDAHTEAPTAGSVILAGVLLKMGTYGFIRFSIPLFPVIARKAAPYILAAAVIGILYGAAVSAVQSDLKRLVAYSSVSHLGFVMLGLFAFTITGAQGSVLQMVNHGLSTGALFLLVGMLYERRHTRQIEDFGGIASVAPAYSGVFLLVALSSLGLPGLNGFVGEFWILLGTFQTNRLAAVLGAGGVVGAALYLLWAYQRTFHGPVASDSNRVLKDLTPRERLVLAPMVALIVLIGVWPQPFFERMEPAVAKVVSAVNESMVRSGDR
ncbi:MAG TPA: NADH-quinone oxidoreductase subunit M [Actinomycetota bacterium]|nr:NADH-quinone oxidoreductase subunit M [Actinomycetota bacterium]